MSEQLKCFFFPGLLGEVEALKTGMDCSNKMEEI
jgi:hypothetical protein